MSKVKFTNNSAEIKRLMQEADTKALKITALEIEGNTVVKVPVDSGNLRNSITNQVEGDTAYVGVPKNSLGADYAVKIEKGDLGRKPQPYLAPAFKNAKQILEKELEIEYANKGLK